MDAKTGRGPTAALHAMTGKSEEGGRREIGKKMSFQQSTHPPVSISVDRRPIPKTASALSHGVIQQFAIPRGSQVILS